MVGTSYHLETFPDVATGSIMNSKVAHRSIKDNKRKRLDDNTAVPEELLALPGYNHEFSTFCPNDTAEVARILKLALPHDLTLSVLNIKGTGTHGNARGGDIIIDLSSEHFQAIEIFQEKSQVRVGGGATSRMVDTALSSHDLITPLVGYTVGLGAFLSGGFGFGSRLHGLTVDNILEVEIVLADGRIVLASETNEPDLFWALKGCGTAYGVVTGLTLRCFPLRRSLSANVIFPFRQDTGSDLLRHWRDCLEDAPDELYSNFVIAAGPDAPENTVAILQICHLGDQDIGMPIIERMASFSGVKYHFKDCNEIDYLRQQELVESVLKGAAVQKNQKPESQVKYLLAGDIIDDLNDDLIDETCKRFQEEAPAGSIWCIELFGGVLADVKESCIPDTQRNAKFHAASIMRVPLDDPTTWRNDGAGRDWIRETISKTSPGGPLPSFLTNTSTNAAQAKVYHDAIRGSYGHENWSRLKKIKKTYDPNNSFRHGFDAGMLGLEEALIDGI